MLNKLPKEKFIEIFEIEKADEAVFGNYQRYDFFQLIWFSEVEGDISYFLDFNEYTLRNNQILLIFPGQIDRMDAHGKKGYLFAIDSETFFQMNQRINSDYLNGYFSNVFLSPDDETKSILYQLQDLLLTEYASDKRLVLMQSYMEAFLFHIASLFENSEDYKNKTIPIIPDLMKLIDNHFIHHRETDFYAKELGISNKKVNEICKKGTGKTVKQHIQERMILEIKKEIRLQKKSLKEIAFELGFNEPAYFTRFFKQHTSLTPKEFRNS